MEEHTEKCDALQILKTSKFNKTPQRLAVLETLIKSGTPLCVNDILNKIREVITINKVTIYRILTSLKQIGIIREIEAGQGVHFYEMACQHNPVHPHFKCRLCGVLTCMSPLTVSQTWDWFAQAKSYSIEHININITGLCTECQSEPDCN